MNQTKHCLRYVVADYISALLVWLTFFIFRKAVVERSVFEYPVPIEFDATFILGLALLPFAWLLVYYYTGFYKNVFHKSRLGDFGYTFQTTFFGTIIIFFVVILDDIVGTYQNYYLLFGVLFGLQFFVTFLFRYLITSWKNRLLIRDKFHFNTLIIGNSAQNVELIEDVRKMPKVKGIRLKGYISMDGKECEELSKMLPYLGAARDIKEIINGFSITDVILSEKNPNDKFFIPLLNTFHVMGINIMASLNMYEYLSSRVNVTALVGSPLIAANLETMSFLETKLKVMLDKSFAFFAILFTSPLFIFAAIGVRLSSKGPIFYSHERVGLNGIPFRIYKFRSMYTDAEKHGPALSRKDDDRTTPFGKFLRGSKMDELPNFYNVLKGDMSLVGPRPERQFFIDKIIEVAPSYLLLQKIKPGITSLGQVKYGYAENVDQMVARLRYDIIYLSKMSLWLDIKIIVNTAMVVLKGRGNKKGY
jgi:exopolysaccharide biosynthesis polyprenyl glycosylphosphotransferase